MRPACPQHGRSHYQWLNDKLDGSAVDHQRKWGCLWNRDILDIVQQVWGWKGWQGRAAAACSPSPAVTGTA